MHPTEYSLGPSMPGEVNTAHIACWQLRNHLSPCRGEDNMTIWSQQCVGECRLSDDVARSGSVPTWSGQAWSRWVYYSSEWFWSWIKPGMERCTIACTSSLWPRFFPAIEHSSWTQHGAQRGLESGLAILGCQARRRQWAPHGCAAPSAWAPAPSGSCLP